MCDSEKTEWDNPPSSYCRRNYFISVRDAEREAGGGCLKFCLKDGHLTQVVPRPPVVVVTDLDGTLLGHEDYLRRFNEIWTRQHMFNEGSRLVYSTGRNLKDFLHAARQFGLLRPDYAICGVGTEIYEFPNREMELSAYCGWLSTLLRREVAREEVFSLLEFQDKGERVDPREGDAEEVGRESNPGFPSWCRNRLCAWPVEGWFRRVSRTFNREELAGEIQQSLDEHDWEYYINGNSFHDPLRLSVSVKAEFALKVYEEIQTNKKSYRFAISGQGLWRYLDILPEKGGKHSSVLFLHEEILARSVPLERFLVCGDSGNDAHMFTIEACKSCCVGNAQQDLKDFLAGHPRGGAEAGQGRVLSEQSELLCRVMASQDLRPPKTVSCFVQKWRFEIHSTEPELD